jgi:hypothetical protein
MIRQWGGRIVDGPEASFKIQGPAGQKMEMKTNDTEGRLIQRDLHSRWIVVHLNFDVRRMQ